MSLRKPYPQPLTRTWGFQTKGYRRYLIREFTSVFIAIYMGILWQGLLALTRGEAYWFKFVNLMTSPFFAVLQLVILVAVLWHTVTWFSLTPKTMAIRIKGELIAPIWITSAHYAVFIISNLIVFWILSY